MSSSSRPLPAQAPSRSDSSGTGGTCGAIGRTWMICVSLPKTRRSPPAFTTPASMPERRSVWTALMKATRSEP